VRAHFDRYGSWIILLSRPVPMLAETVSCLAGLSGMAPGRFAALSLAGTIPLSLVYAVVGANASDAQGLAVAVVVAVGLPALGYGLARWRGLLS
jgi:uncharacterized membrane protein YdjX (TVP38/TMEM64 family)